MANNVYTWGKGLLGHGTREDAENPTVLEFPISTARIIKAACGTEHFAVLTGMLVNRSQL